MSTLRELREENGKSRAEVAAALGVANRTLSHYECGTRFIDIRQVLILANLYECSEREIIEAQLSVCKTKKIIRRNVE